MDFSFGDLLSAGSSILGAITSSNAADDASDRAAAISSQSAAALADRNAKVDEAVSKLSALTPPNLLSYITPYQKQVVAGTLSPEEAVFKMQQDTQLAGITVPQVLLDAQRNALSSIQKIASEGGLTAIDKAQLNDIQTQQAARSAAEQGAIINDAQQRGVSGSGLEMAARLNSQQGAANAAATSGMTVAANAQARALQAIKDSASMASTQRDQDYAEQAKVAAAQDAINNYNTSFANQTSAANTAARNSAQATNLANTQAVSNSNANTANLEAAAKAAAAQQQWTNQFNQASQAANTTAGLATSAASNNNSSQQIANGLNATANSGNAAAIQNIGTAATSLASAYDKYNTKTAADQTTSNDYVDAKEKARLAGAV